MLFLTVDGLTNCNRVDFEELLESLAVLLPDLARCRHDFLKLDPLGESDHCVDLRVNWVLQHQRGQQVCQVLVLLVLEANLDIEDVEADDGIVDESDETFDLFDDLLKKFFVLVSHGLPRLVDFVETQVVLDCL